MGTRPASSKRRRRPPPDGGLEVFVADEQDAHPVDVARWSHLVEQVLEAQGVHGDAELSVLFVDAEVMAGLNRRFMDEKGPTDVLSFPLDDDLVELGRWPDASTTGPDRGALQPEDAPLLLGDVVICPEVAAGNAPDHAGSYEDELALLLVHGVLHVLGMDHVDDSTTAAMQARERELLVQYHGPLKRDPWGGHASVTVLLGATVETVDVAMIVAIVVLLVVMAFLALAETGLTRMSRAKAVGLAESDGRSASALVQLVSHPEEFINPLLLVVLIVQTVQTALTTLVAERLFGGAGVAVGLFVNVVFVFVLCEAAPKTWAVQHADSSAMATARLVHALTHFWPLRMVSRGLIGLTNVILPGKGLKQGPFVSEEELLAVADEAHESETIDDAERALIRDILDFGDTIVREVMVPRTDMITVQSEFRVADVMEIVLLNGYSRVPVCGESIDDIVGIAYAKDLMRAERDGREAAEVSEYMRPAHFVPETKRVAELLREMQADKFHMAIVIDEYGGTAGLVTLEDLIEELVGEIVDEYDVEDPRVEPLPGGDIRVDGRLSIDEANELLGGGLPEGDWDTVGGLLFSTLGKVAAEGDEVEVNGFGLRADKIQGRRITRVRISHGSD